MTIVSRRYWVRPGALLLLLHFIGAGALQAADESVEHDPQALQALKAGWNICLTASRTLRQDVEQAAEVFSGYQAQYLQAIEQDPTIQATPNRDAKKKIRFCNQVNQRIQSTRAEPLLSEAASLCDQSREFLSVGRIKSSRKFFQQYLVARDKTLAVASLKQLATTQRSKIKRCDELAEDLEVAQNGREKYLSEYGATAEILNTAWSQCEKLLANWKKNQTTKEEVMAAREGIEKILAQKVVDGITLEQWIAAIRKQYPIGHKRLSKQRTKTTTCLAQIENQLKISAAPVDLTQEIKAYHESAAVLLQEIDETLTACVLDRERLVELKDTGRLLAMETSWEDESPLNKLGVEVKQLQSINQDVNDEYGLPSALGVLSGCVDGLLQDIQEQHFQLYSQSAPGE